MRPVRLMLLTTLAIAVVACSPTAVSTVAPATAPAAATAAPATPPAASTSVDASSKVSANIATHEELVAALTAGGVANADRWAREIEEYRPYDATDPTLAHLQSELAKYNPDPATLAAILAVLQP
jgi:hypothetical protein